jgi:hypothetical protein
MEPRARGPSHTHRPCAGSGTPPGADLAPGRGAPIAILGWTCSNQRDPRISSGLPSGEFGASPGRSTGNDPPRPRCEPPPGAPHEPALHPPAKTAGEHQAPVDAPPASVGSSSCSRGSCAVLCIVPVLHTGRHDSNRALGNHHSALLGSRYVRCRPGAREIRPSTLARAAEAPPAKHTRRAA